MAGLKGLTGSAPSSIAFRGERLGTIRLAAKIAEPTITDNTVRDAIEFVRSARPPGERSMEELFGDRSAMGRLCGSAHMGARATSPVALSGDGRDGGGSGSPGTRRIAGIVLRKSVRRVGCREACAVRYSGCWGSALSENSMAPRRLTAAKANLEELARDTIELFLLRSDSAK